MCFVHILNLYLKVLHNILWKKIEMKEKVKIESTYVGRLGFLQNATKQLS